MVPIPGIRILDGRASLYGTLFAVTVANPHIAGAHETAPRAREVSIVYSPEYRPDARMRARGDIYTIEALAQSSTGTGGMTLY